MSLVCHHVVSRYTPEERDPVVEIENGDDLWQTESSFAPAQRLHYRPAPSFVSASHEYDEYGMPKAPETFPEVARMEGVSNDVGSWYRSMTSQGKQKEQAPPSHAQAQVSKSGSSSYMSVSNNTQTSLVTNCISSHRPNWFSSGPVQSDAKPSTLADLLSRNPPPLPSEPAFKPPVFLSIGPSNKGFTMLQRKGWQEGEGLGSSRVERRPREGIGMKRALEAAFQDRDITPNILPATAGRNAKAVVKKEVIDLTLSDSEVVSRREVVDLTLSDTESEGGSDEEEAEEEGSHTIFSAEPLSTSHGTTLLAPIPTTLKADRLGIGLKAARHSRSVTHRSAALAAHIRSGNQARMDQARYGRGGRGFARAKRKEVKERVNMLAYLKS